MKAMIFAAGLGTRLRPFTSEHPKALVPVGGVPMLGRVIENIIRTGVTEVVVNVHHFAEQVRAYLRDNDNFGLGARLHVSDESNLLLDTGGGIAHAAHILAPEGSDEAVLVHNADILTNLPLEDMSESMGAGCDALLLVADRDSSRRLLFTPEGIMCGWRNFQTGAVRPQSLTEAQADSARPMAFGGVHMISADTVRDIAAYGRERFGAGETPFSIMDYYIDRCASRRFGMYVGPDGYLWFDIGRPETLEAAQKAMK